jgi:hypothetical protein
VAERRLILARTTPIDALDKPTQGSTLFYTALDRAHVEVHEIHKLGRRQSTLTCCSSKVWGCPKAIASG